jgi:aerobic carbon-monoxide dehydrogenase small subunit
VSREVSLTVNGVARTAAVEERKTLADFLREELGLTGTHLGCEHGICGACTVIVDGVSARSCLMLAVQAEGAQITTIEGLAQDGQLDVLQEACRDSHAFQCGFCTPGFLMTATELLAEHPKPTEGEVREAISGNLCRCTGYQSIVAAIMLAAERGA